MAFVQEKSKYPLKRKLKKETFNVYILHIYLSWSRLYLAARIQPVVLCLYYRLYPITL